MQLLQHHKACGLSTLIQHHADTLLVVFTLLLSVTSLGLGFHLGSRRANALTRRADGRQAEKEDHLDEDEDEEVSDGDLASVQAGFMEQCKLVRFCWKCLRHT